jgi:hypothetical protein
VVLQHLLSLTARCCLLLLMTFVTPFNRHNNEKFIYAWCLRFADNKEIFMKPKTPEEEGLDTAKSLFREL